MPRQKGQKNETPANAAVAEFAVNDAFTPGDGWYSISQTAEMLDLDPNKSAARIRNAIKSSPIFQQPGAVKTMVIPGTNIPPVVYVSAAAIDAYRSAMNDTSTRTRGPRGDRQRWIIDVKHVDRDAVFAALAPFGIEPRNPNKPRNVADDASDADVTGDAVEPVVDQSEF